MSNFGLFVLLFSLLIIKDHISGASLEDASEKLKHQGLESSEKNPSFLSCIWQQNSSNEQARKDLIQEQFNQEAQKISSSLIRSLGLGIQDALQAFSLVLDMFIKKSDISKLESSLVTFTDYVDGFREKLFDIIISRKEDLEKVFMKGSGLEWLKGYLFHLSWITINEINYRVKRAGDSHDFCKMNPNILVELKNNVKYRDSGKSLGELIKELNVLLI